MLKWLIEAPVGDSVLLCSGYIWEPTTGYRILDDELLDSINAGCAAGQITTVAAKLDQKMWRDFYENFVRRLKSSGLSVQAFVAHERNWHAEIAMRLKDNVQILIVRLNRFTRLCADAPHVRCDWLRNEW
jgi:hypothetical protein